MIKVAQRHQTPLSDLHNFDRAFKLQLMWLIWFAPCSLIYMSVLRKRERERGREREEREREKKREKESEKEGE